MIFDLLILDISFDEIDTQYVHMYDENCLENKIDIVSSNSNNISANNNSPKTNIHRIIIIHH